MAKRRWHGIFGRWLAAVAPALLLAPAAAAPPSAPDRPVVAIADGRVGGVAGDGFALFRGIPYAAPPVGERRWRPPAPPARWRGVRDATAFGPACVQPPLPPDALYADNPARMSEDCLTLNIWAPAGAKDAPVILWIHGGSLRIGSSADAFYDGAAYARRGIVFVSINYRLGVLGWFAHPALSAEAADGTSGNYGLRDQIAALAWVRRNIAAFGGDAHNVTVMGESAGALSVSYLLVSPAARGLFDKAILESANIRAVPPLATAAYGLTPAEQTGTALAAGVGAADLPGLRALDAAALVAAAAKARFVAQGTIDGRVLPEQVVDAFDAGRQARVPILAGFNGNEIRSQRGLLPPAPADAATYVGEIERRYGALAPAFLRLYPASDIAGSMLAAVRDAVYGWATERLVSGQAAAGLPAYLYIFDHCYPAAAARGLCGFHASELPFVFGQIDPGGAMPPNWPRPAGAVDRALSDAMIGYWAAFARTGVPAASGLPVWPAYAADQGYMRFADRAVPGYDPQPGMFEVHEELVRRRRAAGQQWFTNVGVAAPLPGATP
ncbi:carboxylesterase/lipase family protein [Sphingomonas flavalba]|uniref:carboxylesterase/lipase family protein n=1 Tax=Sphingomonas flavalba TaxID=2559804 RepID=UPI0039DF5B5E